jgi:hypothetical protein
MSRPDLETADDALADPACMTDEVELLQASIVERLRRAGVGLSAQDVASIAEAVAADAVRVCLHWLERR